MGSSHSHSSRPAPIPDSMKSPKAGRTNLAPQVTSILIKSTDTMVLRSVQWQNQERECYEVAEQMRSNTVQSHLRWALGDIIPGSKLEPKTGMRLLDKILMVFTDEVVNAIIRPGPLPEDRQATDQAQELQDHAPKLEALIAAVIAVDDKVYGFNQETTNDT